MVIPFCNQRYGGLYENKLLKLRQSKIPGFSFSLMTTGCKFAKYAFYS